MKVRTIISEMSLFLFWLSLCCANSFAQWQRASGVGDRFVYSSISVIDDATYAGTESGAERYSKVIARFNFCVTGYEIAPIGNFSYCQTLAFMLK